MSELIEIYVDPEATLPVASGCVTAGMLDGVCQGVEVMNLAEMMGLTRGRIVGVRVSGDSMVEARIFDGDLALVDTDRLPQDGEVVVAEYEGGYTVKYLMHQAVTDAATGQRQVYTWLVPDNPDFEPICFLPSDAPKVVGVYVNPLRQPPYLSSHRFEAILKARRGASPYGGDRRSRIDAAVALLLRREYRDRRPLLRYQKDWGIVMRVLAEQGDFGMTDYRGFLRYAASLPSLSDDEDTSGLGCLALRLAVPPLPSSSQLCRLAGCIVGRYPSWQMPDGTSLPEAERLHAIAEVLVAALAPAV